MKKMTVKNTVMVLILAGLVLLLSSCAEKADETSAAGKLRFVTTLFPLYDFAKNIGGDKVEVKLLLPPGVEAHAFEPKPSDIVRINNADVFVYTGKFMEPWAEDVLAATDGGKLVVADASAGIIFEQKGREDKHEAEGAMDPHIWMDFDNTVIMVDNILEGFAAADSLNKDYYERNAIAYKAKLSALDEKFKRTLSGCAVREIVYAGHYAFGYLAKRYGLEYVAALGFSPDSEPTANDLVKLMELVKAKKIKYIFYEELSSPKIAETIADETGAQMLLLNAAHNLTKEDFEGGATFLAIMENNLYNLKTGLECGK